MPLTGPERADDDLIKAEGLHLRWHDEPEAPDAKRGELLRIREAHNAKIARVEPDFLDHQDSRFLQGLAYEIEKQHPELSAQEVTDEATSRVAFYTAKRDRLVELTRLCDVELAFRDGAKVTRLAELEALESVQRVRGGVK